MNDKVCTLCGRNHSASNCPHTRGTTSTGAWFVKSADGTLKEARPGSTPGLRILAKSAPYLGLGAITSIKSERAIKEHWEIGGE